MCRDHRRCEDKWSATHRAEVNAERRARYAAKKGRAVRTYTRKAEPETASPLPAETSAEEFRLTAEQQKLLDDAGCRISYGDETGEVTERLLSSSAGSELASSPVKEVDSDFSSFTSNFVQRITLENGDIGYWKGLEENGDNDIAEEYGHNQLQSTNNEVAAYRLAVALGPEYESMVPETVIREVGGSVGSFQREVKGSAYGSWAIPSQRRGGVWENHLGKSFNNDQLRAAAIFDYLAGSQDRHSGTIIVRDPDGDAAPALIDNGFSFNTEEYFAVNVSIFSKGVEESGHKPLTETERLSLRSLHDSPDSKGMKHFMVPKAYDRFRERLTLLLEKDRLLESERNNIWGAMHEDNMPVSGIPQYYED